MKFRQKSPLFLLLYIAVCSTAFAQIVEIPNQTLRAAIAQDLGVDVITKDNLERLQGLTIPDAHNLTELTGLEYAKGLITLRMYNHRVTDLTPLQDLVQLEELTMAVGPISDINPLSNLTNLKKLNLDYNKIEDIAPLAGLVGLKELYLPFNQIHDVSPLARLTALRILDLIIRIIELV